MPASRKRVTVVSGLVSQLGLTHSLILHSTHLPLVDPLRSSGQLQGTPLFNMIDLLLSGTSTGRHDQVVPRITRKGGSKKKATKKAKLPQQRVKTPLNPSMVPSRRSNRLAQVPPEFDRLKTPKRQRKQPGMWSI